MWPMGHMKSENMLKTQQSVKSASDEEYLPYNSIAKWGTGHLHQNCNTGQWGVFLDRLSDERISNFDRFVVVVCENFLTLRNDQFPHPKGVGFYKAIF